MPALEIRSRAVGPWPMNTYALVCPTIGEAALVDPGADPEALAALLDGTRPICIILTHTHPDHVGALAEMVARLQVPVLAHPGPHFQDQALPVDRALADGEILPIGAGAVRVVYTPGHIADQLCLIDTGGDDIIVGDTIFLGGPGRTWSAEGFQTSLRSISERVLAWPDSARCHPGHGPSFRLGDVRPRIDAFLARPHDPGFFGDAEW